jgi:hypothetical protein
MGREALIWENPINRKHLDERWAIVCWLVTVFSAYAGGFIMGRLHVPKA